MLLLVRQCSEAFLSARERPCEQTNLYKGATENPEKCNKLPLTNFGKGGKMEGDMHVTEDIKVTTKDGLTKSTTDLGTALPDIQGGIRRTSAAMQALSREHTQLRATIEKVAKKRQDLQDAPIIWPAKATWHRSPNMYCSRKYTRVHGIGSLEQCKSRATNPAHGIFWNSKYRACYSCGGSEPLRSIGGWSTYRLR